MADTLFFSRDSEVFIKIGSDVWQMPVLDGFSFSQATNTSEITLNEMSDASGNSRRGRQMFTDSYAPAEWSFATYARPYLSAGGGDQASGHHHAVEEVLWALMVGDASYSTASSGGAVASLSSIATFTALSGGNKLGANATFHLDTETDGGGSGAQVTLTYTESSGAIVATLHATNRGSGYAATDKLFVSREEIANALGVTLSAITTSLSDNDFEATVATIASTTGTTFTGFTRNGTDLDISFANSNKTTLGTAEIFFVMGKTGGKKVYKITDCVVNEASLDFDIDGIAAINWSGFGSLITDDGATPPTVTVTDEGYAHTVTNNFIRNRLTNLELAGNAGSQTTYDVVLTGGNVTISNNITFLTPESLGIVNQPIGHVTGTRSVTGSFTCYLNTDSNSSADLFNNIIEDTDQVTNVFDLTFNVGGANSLPRLELFMTQCHLEVPTHSTDDVISVEANFHALPTTIDGTNELAIKYVGKSLTA